MWSLHPGGNQKICSGGPQKRLQDGRITVLEPLFGHAKHAPNERVVDGTGELGFIADVAVQDGKIVGVGKYAGAAAKRTIDAAGRVVAPGFIDHHTHYDPQAVWDPLCSSSVQNGHTMVIVGQCGQVLAPTRPGDGAWYLEFFADAEAIPLSTIKAGVDVTWESVGDYLDALGKKRGINVGTLVGHKNS